VLLLVLSARAGGAPTGPKAPSGGRWSLPDDLDSGRRWAGGLPTGAPDELRQEQR
jgi:hypothetical protein